MNNVVGIYVVGIFIIYIWQSQASVADKFKMIKCGFVPEDSSYDGQMADDIISGYSIPIIRGGQIVEYYSTDTEGFYSPDAKSLSSWQCEQCKHDVTFIQLAM